MATLVSLPVRYVAVEWEDAYPSAVLSGIVPDERHLEDGGYHCSIEDLIRFGNSADYSNRRPDDKGWNPRFGAAIDMSMSPADMKLCFKRIKVVFDDPSDPRRKYINAFNCWDGIGSADRLDFVISTWGSSSNDHKWHNHLEIKRRYLLDWTAARAIVSMLRGDTKAQYIVTGGDNMSWAEQLSQVYKGEKYTNRAGEWLTGTHVLLHDLTAQVTAMKSVIESLAETIRAGGGDVDTTAILAGVEAKLEKHREAVRLDTRDAVADYGEGGSDKVRSEETEPTV